MVTTDCEGATQAWADLEHLAATDSFGKQHAAMLSAPMPVMSFDFSSLTALPPASRSVTLDVPATVSGVLNCVTFWWVPIGARICPERRVGPDCAASGGRYDLDLGDLEEGAPTIALGPDWTAPRCFETRARRQQLRYLKYERALVEGERVRACTACHSWTRFGSDCQ